MIKRYIETLDNLTKAIFGGQTDPAMNMISERPKTSKKKALDVYINGYQIRMKGVVANNYPALKYYLGDERFFKWVKRFTNEVKSESYNLDFYPFKFHEYFIARNQKDKFANELCHLECEIQKVFFLPDSEALTMNEIAAIPPEKLGDMILKLRMASIGLSFSCNVNEYLAGFRKGEKVKPRKAKEYVFICRNNNLVQRSILTELEFIFLSEVKNGRELSHIFEKLAEKYPQEEIIKAFNSSVVNGFFRI